MATRSSARHYRSPLPWFRLYTEFADDPKVQMLSETMQRRFIVVLCLTGKGIVPTDDDAAVSFAMRLSVKETARTKATLTRAKLIGKDWKPLAWDRRQFKSDHDAAERKRRQRQREKGERDTWVADRNGVTTASRDSHDLEQKQRRTESDVDQNRAAEAHARMIGSAAANGSRNAREPESGSVGQALARELAALGVECRTDTDKRCLEMLIEDYSREKLLQDVMKAREPSRKPTGPIPVRYLNAITRKLPRDVEAQ